MPTTIPKYFILTALAFFLVGCLEGLMFPTKTMFQGLYATLFQLPPEQIKPFFNLFVAKIHTHINLLGWIGSALMGVLYFVVPQIAGQNRIRPWVAMANYICNTLGVVLLALGFHLIGHFGAGLPYESPEFRVAIQPVKTVAMLGGGLVFLSALLFAYNMGRTLGLRRPQQSMTASTAHRFPMVAAALLTVFLGGISMFSRPVLAAPTAPVAPQSVDAIMIGDRLVDVAYNLGVLPKAMAVRASFWPLSDTFRNASEIIGCPSRILKKPETVPNAAKRLGVTRIIIEKHPRFCTYMPSTTPEKVVPLLEGKGLHIEYVDFGQGLDAAIRQTGKLLGREDAAETLIARHEIKLARAEKMAQNTQSGKRVLILNGIYQKDTGKSLVQVEVPGGYSDRFLLAKLGAVNVGQAFLPENAAATKGYFTVGKRKGEVDLTPLRKAAPDVIVVFGNAYAVQKALATAIDRDPTLALVPAVKKQTIYVLPQYVDSGVLEYPEALALWTDALCR